MWLSSFAHYVLSFIAYLTTQGINPKSHSIKHELVSGDCALHGNSDYIFWSVKPAIGNCKILPAFH